MAVAHCFAALHRARGAIQVTLRPLPVHEVPPQELTYINKHGLVKTRSVSNAIFYHLLAFHSIVLCGAVLIQVHSTPGTSRSPGFGREHEDGYSRMRRSFRRLPSGFRKRPRSPTPLCPIPSSSACLR